MSRIPGMVEIRVCPAGHEPSRGDDAQHVHAVRGYFRYNRAHLFAPSCLMVAACLRYVPDGSMRDGMDGLF